MWLWVALGGFGWLWVALPGDSAFFILLSAFARARQAVQEGRSQRGDCLRPPEHYVLVNQALLQRAEDDAGCRQHGYRLRDNRYPQTDSYQPQHRLTPSSCSCSLMCRDNGGLGEMQPLRGTREMQFLRHGQKTLRMSHLHVIRGLRRGVFQLGTALGQGPREPPAPHPSRPQAGWFRPFQFPRRRQLRHLQPHGPTGHGPAQLCARLPGLRVAVVYAHAGRLLTGSAPAGSPAANSGSMATMPTGSSPTRRP